MLQCDCQSANDTKFQNENVRVLWSRTWYKYQNARIRVQMMECKCQSELWEFKCQITSVGVITMECKRQSANIGVLIMKYNFRVQILECT